MNLRLFALLLLSVPLTAYGWTVKTPASEAPYVFFNKTPYSATVQPIKINHSFEQPVIVQPSTFGKIGSIALMELLNPIESREISNPIGGNRHRVFYVTFVDNKIPSFVVHTAQEPVSNTVTACAEKSTDPLNSNCAKNNSAPNKKIYTGSLKNFISDLLDLGDGHHVKTKTFMRFGTIALPEVQIIVE